jgi:hypothetical protein
VTWAEPATIRGVPVWNLIAHGPERTAMRLNAVLPEGAPWRVGWFMDEYGRVIHITPGAETRPGPGAPPSRRQSQAAHLADQLRAVIKAEEASR